MEKIQKLGRPKEFDTRQVVDTAVGIFWMKGYDGASMKDLTTGMGISAPSLYAAFGDKRGLFLQAIDQYVNSDACAPLTALEEEDDIEKAVSNFFNAAISYSTQHACGAKGCFLASSVATSAGSVDGVEKLLSKAIELTDARISARFEREKIKGTLPENFPSIERAKLLFDLRQGLVFRARSGINAKTLKRDMKSRVRMVLDYSDAS